MNTSEPQPLTLADVLAIEPGDHPSPIPVTKYVNGKTVPMTASDVRNMYLIWLRNAASQRGRVAA